MSLACPQLRTVNNILTFDFILPVADKDFLLNLRSKLTDNKNLTPSDAKRLDALAVRYEA